MIFRPFVVQMIPVQLIYCDMYTRLLFYQKTEGLRERLAGLRPFVLIYSYFAQDIFPFLPLNIRSFYLKKKPYL